jgi:hypothetical protein
MKKTLLLTSLLCLTLLLSAVPSFCAAGEPIGLDGGGLHSLWDPATGRLTGLAWRSSEASGAPAFSWVASSQGGAGFEVFDELERVRYSDRGTPCRVSDLSVTQMGALKKVSFVKHFEGAPFAMKVTLTADIQGLRLETETVLQKQADGQFPRQRNVRVSFVLPAAESVLGWAPGYPDPSPLTVSPVRYCYGMQEPGLPRVGIPLYSMYAPGKAGLGIAMPLDLPKVQLSLGPEPEDPSGLYVEVNPESPMAEVALAHVTAPAPLKPEEIRVVRLTEFLVGLTADRPLRFAVLLFPHAPHWRPALGALVRMYPDYFGMQPKMRSLWGSRLGANVHVTPSDLAVYNRFGATTSWLHTHFYRHGEFIPPEAVCNPDYTFFCEPYASEYPDNSVNKNRRVIDLLSDNGQAVFLYGFNMHCDTITVVQRGLFADVTRNRDGSVTKCYHDQPVMFFSPESPFGRHQLEQMDLMLKLYPRIMGIALDNWSYGGIDFAHDDGITMFGNRPAASVNFSQQRMIGAIAGKWHSAGRLVMVNKARTIESLKGADSMLSEAEGSEIFAMFAYMCLDRHLHPNEYEAAKNPKYAEYTLQYTLEWGGQIGSGQEAADPDMTQAYYTLLLGLRNRTWVLDPDPLTLPAGARGNIFRIHPQSPWDPGDIVVPLFRPGVTLAQCKFADGLKVKVRLPEGGRIARASWLGVEDYRKPALACRVEKKGGEITLSLPPVGAAGILRLELE